MAATRAAARAADRGLSTDDLQTIQHTLAAGRKPKVMFTETAGQIAGQVGQVVGLTDPAISDEWVVVRFGRDELPFSPADLSIPPRGTATKRIAGPPPPAPEPPPAAPQPEFKVTREAPAPTPRERKPAAVERKETPVSPTTTDPEVAIDAAAPSAPDAPAEKPARKVRPVKAKAPASLTVTLAYTDGEWTVAATQGSKALAKPYVIKPAEALKMVALVDVPGVQEAVEHILSSERADAEQQAGRLRAELAEIEARLAELRDAG